MKIKNYLKRINFRSNPVPSLSVLSELQKSHLLSVPFENLDIHRKVKINLENTYDKIVNENRGGFCYELNGLFYKLLKELGFEVKMASARVYRQEIGYGPEFGHLVNIVLTGNINYLVEVGFGEFAFHPLKIEFNTEQADQRGVFKIERDADDYLVVKKKNPDGEFIPQYKFTETERHIEEFWEMCEFHQTNENSHFTRNVICSLPTEKGRITFSGSTFTITTNGSSTEWNLTNDDDVGDILLKYFNIKIDGLTLLMERK